MKKSEFRMWVYNLYLDNREEREIFRDDLIDVQTYFKKYRWWLKREFAHQKKEGNI